VFDGRLMDETIQANNNVCSEENNDYQWIYSRETIFDCFLSFEYFMALWKRQTALIVYPIEKLREKKIRVLSEIDIYVYVKSNIVVGQRKYWITIFDSFIICWNRMKNDIGILWC
jgi:hypothetical protein